MVHVRLTIKVKVGIPESFKVGWYPHKITGSSHLKWNNNMKPDGDTNLNDPSAEVDCSDCNLRLV